MAQLRRHSTAGRPPSRVANETGRTSSKRRQASIAEGAPGGPVHPEREVLRARLRECEAARRRVVAGARAVRTALDAMEKELEALAARERELSRLTGNDGSGARRAFWQEPDGLALRAASYDRRRDQFVVSFAAGPEYRMPANAVELSAPVKRVGLDEFQHGVVVRLVDGSETTFASDLVLHECEPAYRASLPSPPAPEPDFGARIRELRLSAGLQAKEVAAAAGIAASNYARLEASKHQPRVETLVRVAEALGVPLVRLVAAR